MVGFVVTTSPICKRYKMVVLPAPSKPRINIRNSLFEPHSLSNIELKMLPILIYNSLYWNFLLISFFIFPLVLETLLLTVS
ncbi:hypothetical protein AWRI1631_22480 [Saccharomyces cerevisiae AWRI1631]|uniref:Uncharacterized protein n=1 Tax=Saccharomyces cerevisiae (strain AWRI1631) TaxID=545124 RepID=B5VEC1_YEAS6|nr:hypothetical protein AWRI1631_22480 [Saccharomyces cerevisiae AWRI1631]